MKANKTMRGLAVSNLRRRNDKESESSIDSGAHNQILKQQKQVNGRNHHVPLDVTTEYQWSHLSHQKTPFDKLDSKGTANNLLLPGDPSH
jgi:hypothetical protein